MIQRVPTQLVALMEHDANLDIRVQPERGGGFKNMAPMHLLSS